MYIRSPRLMKGYIRKQVYNRLPEEYKEAIRAIAKHEGKSMTWVIEEILVEVIGNMKRIAKPKYLRKS